MSFATGAPYERPVRINYRGIIERLARVNMSRLIVLRDSVVSMFVAQQKLTVTNRAEVSELTNLDNTLVYRGTRRTYGYVEYKTPVDVVIAPTNGYLRYVPQIGYFYGDNTYFSTPISGLNAPTFVKKSANFFGWDPANGSLNLDSTGYWRVRYTVDLVRIDAGAPFSGLQFSLFNNDMVNPNERYARDYIVYQGPVAVGQVITLQGEYTRNHDIYFGTSVCLALQAGVGTNFPFTVRILESSILAEYISANDI